MAKGKGKKGKADKKVVKEPPQKEYAMISLEDLRAIEARQMSRVADTRTTLYILEVVEGMRNFYSSSGEPRIFALLHDSRPNCEPMIQYINAIQEVEVLKAEETILETWLNYVNCNQLPKPFRPPEIRLFFVKLRHFEKENVEKTIDWQLPINERSILNQSIYRTDMTRRALIKEVQNFGDEYNENIDLGLKVIESIELFLGNKKENILTPERILEDIKEQKIVVQQEIMQFFDRYSYRVLCSEKAYMKRVDAINLEYCYEGNNFEIHLWTLKHVPIIFNIQDHPSLEADLHQINVIVQMPFSVLKEDLTVRGLHFKFDHFSEHAKTYEPEVMVSIDDKNTINTGVADMDESLKHEWVMLRDLQNEVRTKLIATRLEYEEKIRLMEEEAARKAKEEASEGKKAKKPGKEPKPKKMPREPQTMPEGYYPDVWDDFIEKEKTLDDNLFNDVYHPKHLNLTDYEINLKQYMILGGIYQLYFVTKPDHIDFDYDTLNLTWHANNGILFIDKNVQVGAPKVSITRRRTSRFDRPTLVPTAAEARPRRTTVINKPGEEPNNFTTDVETSPWFVITFKLPQYLCLWGEPVPCQYEADVVGYIELFKAPSILHPGSLTDATSNADAGSVSNTSGHMSISTIQQTAAGPSIVPQSEHQSISHTGSQAHLDLFMPQARRGTRFRTDAMDLEDFNINLPMTKLQIRNIERHCVPRIISSFKFPIEILEEETEESRNKPKGEGGTLVRKRLSDLEAGGDIRTSDRVYDMQKQKNPERLFPLFPKTEYISLPNRMDGLVDKLKSCEPETFLELIEVLDAIKKHYRTKLNQVLEVPVFNTKYREERMRQRQQIIFNQQQQLLGSNSNNMLHESKSHKPAAKQSIFERRKSALLRRMKNAADDISGKGDDKKDESDHIEIQKFLFSHWSKENILHSEYDKANCTVTIWTDRLGTFGMAFKRYEHFPFRNWSLEPSEENPETEIVLRVDTQYVRCFIYISADGYRGYVTDFSTKYVRNPVKYLEIIEPIHSLNTLKKLFREKHLNIFTNPDARLYIENGYFSEKHAPTELHTYICMAIHCLAMKFRFSDWNRLAQRRDIILRLAHIKDTEDYTIRITPEDATFVDVKELCSDDLDVVTLEYSPTWRNIEAWSDLHHMILSTYATTESRGKDASLTCYVKNILRNLRLLSYS